MQQSILLSVKKTLGLEISEEAEYNVFDEDVLMHINSVLSILTQVGIGSSEGFTVEDENATWADFCGTDKRIQQVRSYVILRVRLLFDPPSTSYHITSMNEQIREMEWRLNISSEVPG